MLSAIRRLKCRIRGYHDGRCTIVVLPGAGLQEHTHSCDTCETITLASITRIDPQISVVMGMTIEEQQHTYLN